MDNSSTGFKDKTGRLIFLGDIVQHRLGKFGKSVGTKQYQVIKFGKKVHLVDESAVEAKYGGMPLTNTLCEHLVVIDSQHLPQR